MDARLPPSAGPDAAPPKPRVVLLPRQAVLDGAFDPAWAALAGGIAFPLGPGEALFVPVMAPHFVRNGPEPSVSLSITWRSEWSFAEADARAFNSLLRR